MPITRTGLLCAVLLCLQKGTDPRATTTVLGDLLFNILKSFLEMLFWQLQSPMLDQTSPTAPGRYVQPAAQLRPTSFLQREFPRY